MKPLKSLVYFSLFLSVIQFVSCDRTTEYPGYSESKTGIYYKLLEFGESTEKAQAGDYITADINYLTMNDSLFFSGRRKLKTKEPAYEGSIDECFQMLAEDEKAIFIISADDFFRKTLETSLPQFLDSGQNMKIQIDMVEIQTQKDYLKEKEAFLSWIEDFGEYEKVVLKQFIEEREIEVDPTKSGLFHLVLQEGSGPEVSLGDTVTVHFEGKFLNGKFFDSTKRRNQPFQFVYGKKWQVIEGLEEAIGRMKQGERALFIIPSSLGFGETGSSTGIVPPYTSTIFEVELIEVAKGPDLEKEEDINKYD